MNQTLRVLLEVTVYSFVLFAAVMVFKRMFRKHISPILGYAVWALLILRLIVPVTINSDMRLFVIPQASLPQIQTQVLDEAEYEDAPVAAQRDNSSVPVYNNTVDSVSYEEPVTAAEIPAASQSTAADSKPAYSKPLNWQFVLVILWAGGMAVSAAWLRLLSVRIKRRTLKGHTAPENILQLVDACKREMGIKADLEVLVQDWIDTPALTASFRPKLLLPQSMLMGMDIRQIEYGIRHELMHYRHRDYLTALLLMLLRSVYWFNPVVWLAVRQIETDMEAACDASVTASLNKTECFDYAQTMIDLGSKASVYMLGMGVSNSRQAMEKRVRGIFMNKRTKMPVRFAAFVLSSLLVFTCFTTACQPIQAEAIANTSAIEVREDVAAAPSQPVPTPTPEPNPNEGYGNFPDWVETYSIPHLEVDINAQVVTPETDVFPVYKVKQRSFDDETLQRIVDYFTKDAIGVRDFSYTEDELTEQLNAAKSFNSGKEEIASIKEELKNVKTETFSPVTVGMALDGWRIYLMDKDEKVYSLIHRDEDSSDEIYISKYSFQYGIQPERWIRDDGPTRLVNPMEEAFEKMKISEEEARIQAQMVIADLGIDYMGVARLERAIVVNGYSDDIMSGGWVVTCARKDGNSVPISNKGVQPSFMFMEDEFAERWFDESLQIYVDDGGVQSFSWNNTIDITEVTEENATIMSFEDAKQAIRNNIEYGYSDAVEQQFVYGEHSIKVNQIVLANVVVPVSDDLNYQMLVPAWLVYYKEIPPDRFDYTNVFAMNAIDGTPIDLTMRGHLSDEDFARLSAES